MCGHQIIKLLFGAGTSVAGAVPLPQHWPIHLGVAAILDWGFLECVSQVTSLQVLAIAHNLLDGGSWQIPRVADVS